MIFYMLYIYLSGHRRSTIYRVLKAHQRGMGVIYNHCKLAFLPNASKLFTSITLHTKRSSSVDQ